jgi:hypothetical protein
MQSRAASELGITKLLPQKLSEMFLPVSLLSITLDYEVCELSIFVDASQELVDFFIGPLSADRFARC